MYLAAHYSIIKQSNYQIFLDNQNTISFFISVVHITVTLLPRWFRFRFGFRFG